MPSETHLTQTAKLFTNGRSQAVLLPVVFRFDAKEVFVRQGPKTGNVILSHKPTTWDGFFTAMQGADVPEDFLNEAERAHGGHNRYPLERWRG